MCLTVWKRLTWYICRNWWISGRTFHLFSCKFKCSFIIIIFIYDVAWNFARCDHENFNYYHYEKQKWWHQSWKTAMSKIFELCLSRIMDVYLFTNDNQCGFKQKNPPNYWLMFVVKSIIQYYNFYSGPVYTCYLDAWKAFDRINHWTMFKQLIF